MGNSQRRCVILMALVIGGACNGMPTDGEVTVPGDTGQIHRVIVRAPKPYDELVRSIEEMGGRVTQRYRYVDAIAAEVPDSGMAALRGQVAPEAISKDVMHALPTVARDRWGQPAKFSVRSQSVRVLDPQTIQRLASVQPSAYVMDTLGLMNMAPLFGDGFLGEGIKVAVIDSGIRPGFPHIEMDGSVIGGENLTEDGIPFSDPSNDGHGTFVSGMISANAFLGFDPTDRVAVAVSRYCPTCVIQVDDNDDGVIETTLIPMIGSAPSSSIYMLKVFPADNSATPDSIVLAAMERVLELKQNFLAGQPEIQNPDGSFTAANIQVLNISLGGYTLYAGRDLEDQLTQQFADAGIVMTKSAGNAGPSGTTGDTPGTGIGGLTVGAASVALNERIFMDLQFGPGIGALWRPTEHVQTAFFSARGPTADGRMDPELVSSGDWNFGQGFGETDTITMASSSGYSAPSVAGVAAVLRQVAPTATAREVEAALVQSANPRIIADGSGVLDQGAGYVDGAGAAELLRSGDVIVDEDLGEGGRIVLGNIDDLVRVEQRVRATRTARQLRPGQRFETYYSVPRGTSRVIVTLDRVLPGRVQNQIFGDDILFTVHSSKTHGVGDYLAFSFSHGGTFVFQAPEPGLMRITLAGDWTNASPIDARVTMERTSEPLTRRTAFGDIAEGEQIPVEVTVPVGINFLDVGLRWRQDWGRYPTSDLDVIALSPDGAVFFDGASLDAPERFTVTRPAAGRWTFLVDGFTVFGDVDSWALSVLADGTFLRRSN